MNPPYGHKVKDWIRKAYYSHIKYNVSGLALLFAKVDTQKFGMNVFFMDKLRFILWKVELNFSRME